MQAKTFRLTLLTLAVTGAVGAVYVNLEGLSKSIAPVPVTPVNAVIGAPPALPAIMPDFADIMAKNGPSVVNIGVSGHTQVAMTETPQIDPNYPLFEFFRRFQPPGEQGVTPTHGMGSGFIVRPDGLIITNAHVVDGASEVGQADRQA